MVKVMVRLFFSQAAVHQMHLLHMDILTAFLHGEMLQENLCGTSRWSKDTKKN